MKEREWKARIPPPFLGQVKDPSTRYGSDPAQFHSLVAFPYPSQRALRSAKYYPTVFPVRFRTFIFHDIFFSRLAAVRTRSPHGRCIRALEQLFGRLSYVIPHINFQAHHESNASSRSAVSGSLFDEQSSRNVHFLHVLYECEIRDASSRKMSHKR